MTFMADQTKDKTWLSDTIRERKTLLTVGLDTDLLKLPPAVEGDLLKFNQAIIDATRDHCIAYKINFAFYESLGIKGWEIMEQTLAHIGNHHFTIADAKRGDIGNTSEMYARAVFDHLGFDSITIHPYMGADSVKPFLRDGKWVILLALTSNEGSKDFQQLKLESGRKVYEEVMEISSWWGSADNMMYVVGATHPDELLKIRTNYPEHFFLVPGVGAQGGDLVAICEHGMTSSGGLLINASRSILYAGSGEDFAEKAQQEAAALNSVMSRFF